MLDRFLQLLLNEDLDPAAGGSPAVIDSGTPEEREALEGKVKANLAAIFGSEESEEGEEKPDGISSEEEEGAEVEEEELDDPAPSEEEEEEEESGGEAAVEDTIDPDAPTLPDAHRRSLQAYDWSDEDIDQNLRALGDKFLLMASKIHANRNAETASWAAAGREAREAQERGSNNTGSQPPSAPTIDGLKPLNVSELKEKYGDDAFVEEIAGPVNATIEAINAIIPTLQAGQQAAQQAELDRITKQVDTFFSSDPLKPYEVLYGSSEKGLTDAQIQSRNRVLDTAFDLIAGAQAVRRQNLPFEEALTVAHDLAAKDYKETAIRSGIKKEAKKRNRSITLKPSTPAKERTLERSGSPRNRTELESRTRSRLKAVFG